MCSWILTVLIQASILLFSIAINENKPCLSRAVPGESVICVCSETYCDNIIREQPTPSKYITYTSSKAGSRFKKRKDVFKGSHKDVSLTLELDPKTTYQTIEGFGGAITDAAGINWRNLSDALQEYMIKSYFSDRGLEYNMLRVPIGGSDFSTRFYAYNELPKDDARLTNYTLAYEDYQYKMPMIKAAMNASSTSVHIVASTWSTPLWMTTTSVSGRKYLKREYYQTYADYHYKFVEKYSNNEIPIWGITTTNQPVENQLPTARVNELMWTSDGMGDWIENNLGPTIRNSTFKELKIIAADDQRFVISFWFNKMVDEHPKVLKYIDSLGVHYYADEITSPKLLQLFTDSYPNKFILGTEASEGFLPWSNSVKFGSWDRAKHYVLDIITDLNYNVIGWLDWNLCLNEEGGPNWTSNFVDSPVVVLPEKMEFIKQPLFYAMGHFSKFVPRGSRRIKVTEHKDPFILTTENVAFLTPRNTIVIILYNNNDNRRQVGIKLKDKETFLTMEAHSVMTAEFQYE